MAAGGTPEVDWEAASDRQDDEAPTGVTVSEQAAKALANHTFLSNVKWSSFSSRGIKKVRCACEDSTDDWCVQAFLLWHASPHQHSYPQE